jgi:hypothetical protein
MRKDVSSIKFEPMERLSLFVETLCSMNSLPRLGNGGSRANGTNRSSFQLEFFFSARRNFYINQYQKCYIKKLKFLQILF